MRESSHPRARATAVCVVLASLFVTAAQAVFAHRLADQFAFVESAKSRPQTKSKRRSRKQRQATTTSKNSTTTSQKHPTTQQPSASPTSPGPLSQVRYELPIRKPGVGESQERGLLERVDCNGNVATFVVKVGARTLKLRTANFNAVQYRTYAPEVSGDITCGARNPANAVVVTFRPTKDSRAKFDGEVISVEFVPKDFELRK